jgi:hypothetical protein
LTSADKAAESTMKIRNVLEVREEVEVNPLPKRYGLRV